MKIARLLLAFALLLVAAPLFAQQRAQGPRSPEVLPDNRVTFRLSARAATTVALNGEWAAGQPAAMTKDEQGVWMWASAGKSFILDDSGGEQSGPDVSQPYHNRGTHLAPVHEIATGNARWTSLASRSAATSALIATNPLLSCGPWLCDNEAGSEAS